jgi:putative DNA primase/helicase
VADNDGPESGKGSNGTDTAVEKASSSERSVSRPKRILELPVNAIEAGPKPGQNQNVQAGAAVAESAAAPSASPLASPTQRADTDPWTVPQSVRDRFVQDRHRFYFPDGAPAFRDRGRRLTTASENTQVIHSLIEIAQSRGWTQVTVTGTERFRQQAWQQARLAGLEVRGYRPSEEERAQLIRALGRNLVGSPERVDSISADVPPAAPPREAAQPAAATTAESRERIAGKLLDHGRDAYRHDPNEDPSYFVRLSTRDGVREIWGRDIERAVTKSLTRPQIGDEVVLQRTGRDAVTVKRQERDPEGQFRSKNVEAFRNRWFIEKQSFFEVRAAAAQIVRDDGIAAREAVREHPELAGTYLNLRAAELASRTLRDSQDRRRFVSQVRSALADDIERGEPLQPVRLRERTKEAKDRTPLSRE